MFSEKFLLTGLLTLFIAALPPASFAQDADVGPNPTLVEPSNALIPTVNIAPAKGWDANDKPVAASGFEVSAFAGGFQHPRWIYVLDNGDVLVAETNAPPKPEDSSGIKGWIMKQVMGAAGAATPSADRITLLRDTDKDGVADVRTAFLENLYSPFGMAQIGNDFYVANTDAVMRFPYQEGQTKITDPGEKVIGLPGGPLNHHWTKSLVASPDGRHLYVGVGSNSNVSENGIEKEQNRAAIWEIELPSGNSRVFANGLRNPVGIDWQPHSGELWTVVNERDELGNNLVPDFLTSVKDGAFYGWPYSYYGDHVDTRVKPQRPDLVETAMKPDFALGSHRAPLGLAFYDAELFPSHYRNGAFIGEHGSWNRDPPSGYKVVFVPFKDGKPSGMPENFLMAFLDKDGNAQGRPVGVAVDKQGALLVVDDVGNMVWRVKPE